MRCEPDDVYSVIRPPVPVPRTIPLAIVWSARMVLTDDASGRVDPAGCAVTKPLPALWVTVTVPARPSTPLAGTPPAPVTCTSIEPLAATAPPAPRRVSTRRLGVTGTNRPRGVARALALPVT